MVRPRPQDKLNGNTLGKLNGQGMYKVTHANLQTFVGDTLCAIGTLHLFTVHILKKNKINK